MPIIKQPKKAILMNALDSSDYQEFQFNPQPVTENIGVEYKEMNSPGLSHPFYQFVCGKGDEVSFDIELDDKGMYYGYTGEFLMFLYKFCPPWGGIKKFTPPPPAIVSYGGFVRRVLISNLQVSRDRFDPDTLKVTKAAVKVTIKTLP